MNSTQTTNPTAYLAALLSRARGCLLGQLAGDSLGSLVEFKTAERIRELYPEGVTRMANGGAWNTLAGQPTDDSEMALALARSLVKHQTFKLEAVRQSYIDWVLSKPFDIGHTTFAGLGGSPNHASEANGSLMANAARGICGRRHHRHRDARR